MNFALLTMKWKTLLIFFFLIGFNLITQAQKWMIESETGVISGSRKSVPLGLHMNQWGEVPTEGPSAFQRFRIRDTLRVVHANRPNWKMQYGLSTAINLGAENSLRVSSAYVGFRTKTLGIRVGRWREVQGLVDSTLSSGSFTWSGNALPLPRVELGIPEYTPLFGSSLVAVKGFIAHGWFNNGAVVGSWLHQKSAYFRVGKPEWKLKFYSGINHQVQWGGVLTQPIRNPNSNELISALPSDWKSYLDVVLGTRLNRDGTGANNANVPLNESLNRVGNHLGGVDIGFELESKKGTWLFYKQSFFEDGSLYFLTNIGDGVYGLRYQNKSIRRPFHIVLEVINSLNQGGGNFVSNPPQLRGLDNYFNNSLYSDGWAYQGRVLGHPFLMLESELNPSLREEYADFVKTRPMAARNSVLSNRVLGFHLKMAYKISKIQMSTQVIGLESRLNYSFPGNANLFSFTQTFGFEVGKRGNQIRTRWSGQFGTLLSEGMGAEVSFYYPIRL